MSPILKWGLGVGLMVAAVDSFSLYASRGLAPDGDAAQYIAIGDQLANVILFSLAGLRVGRETRIVRAAAEAGVLAGTVAGLAAILVPLAVSGSAQAPTTTQQIVGTLALNVAMGGVVAMLNGWAATRRRPSAGR